jgi:hypothetical protein
VRRDVTVALGGTVSTGAALPVKRVLRPVDFSEPAKAAVRAALSIAQEGDAEIGVHGRNPLDLMLFARRRTRWCAVRRARC